MLFFQIIATENLFENPTKISFTRDEEIEHEVFIKTELNLLQEDPIFSEIKSPQFDLRTILTNNKSSRKHSAEDDDEYEEYKLHLKRPYMPSYSSKDIFKDFKYCFKVTSWFETPEYALKSQGYIGPKAIPFKKRLVESKKDKEKVISNHSFPKIIDKFAFKRRDLLKNPNSKDLTAHIPAFFNYKDEDFNFGIYELTFSKETHDFYHRFFREKQETFFKKDFIDEAKKIFSFMKNKTYKHCYLKEKKCMQHEEWYIQQYKKEFPKKPSDYYYLFTNKSIAFEEKSDFCPDRKIKLPMQYGIILTDNYQ